MQNDPTREWQRLTRLYEEMSDEQLIKLAETFGDLTEVAQPTLRDELKKRGLEEAILQPPPPRSDRHPTVARVAPRFLSDEAPEEDDGEGDDDIDEEPLVEYTWKTELCECSTAEESWQYREVLRLAGIESWEDRASSIFGSQLTRLLVAADQLDEARAALARPIPQEIIDHSKAKVEDFVPPACPKCGASDPLLESVEPVNTWRCEACDAVWADSAAFNSPPPEPVE